MLDEGIKNLPVPIEELARWSPWPARLLGVEPFLAAPSNPASIEREFGRDKWGALLKIFSEKSSFTLVDIEAAEQNLNGEIACYDESIGFYISRAGDAINRQLNYYEAALNLEVDGASSLVELGAGYGNKLFSLSEKAPFKHLPLYAAEYTKSGCDLVKLISKKLNKKVQVGYCDFNDLEMSGLEIPPNSIIFTSYSVHYVPALRKQFVEFLLKLKPKTVFHFEPCYEHYDLQSLHGLMCRRYMQLNHYTKNIASQIEEGCANIGAQFEAKHNSFGSNPFLPFSIIKWTPKY